MTSFYAVQTYRRGNKGVLLEDTPIVCSDRAVAERTAERLAKTRAGAVAFVRTANDFDEYSDAVFLAHFGEVPENVSDALEILF